MNQQNRLRETYVDVDNERRTRKPCLREAWQEAGRDLVSGAPAIDLDGDEVEAALPRTDFLVAAITPRWLNGPDGTLSYSTLVFRSVDRRLYDRQRDHILGRDDADGQQMSIGDFGDFSSVDK